MKQAKYTKTDKKIDAYLKTENLRPGPPARLINRIFKGKDNTSPTQSHRINYLSFTLPLTRNINWTELAAVKLAEYGSETSYFLEFLNNRQLILKAPNDVAQYYFGSLMFNSFGLPTPKVRLIEYSDPEFKTMLLNLERASQIDIGIHNKIIHEVKEKPFVLLYEYIPFLNLFELGENRANALLSERNFKSRELMITLGRIITLDIYLNNDQRMPMVWLNNGNANNLIFKVNIDLLPPNAPFKDHNVVEVFLDTIYALDTKPMILDPNDKVMLHNLGNYLNDLNDAFKLLCYEFKCITIYGKSLDAFEFQSFDKLSAVIKNSTSYVLTSTNKFHIALGMLSMVNEILEAQLKPISSLINHVVSHTITKDFANAYSQSADTLKSQYFRYLLDFFQKIKDDNDQIFAWIDDITFGTYQDDVKGLVPPIIEKQNELVYKGQPDEAAQPSQPSEEEKEGEKIKPKEYREPPKDFFNHNQHDNRKFRNDVHNGIYDIYDLEDDLVIEVRQRKYKEIESKPPEPEDLPPPEEEKKEKEKEKEEEEKPPIPVQKKLEIENLQTRDKHTVRTIKQLTDDIKKNELYDTYNMKKKLNPEEANYLKNKIDEVDENFFTDQEKEQMKQKKEKDRLLKEQKLREKEEDSLNKSKSRHSKDNVSINSKSIDKGSSSSHSKRKKKKDKSEKSLANLSKNSRTSLKDLQNKLMKEGKKDEKYTLGMMEKSDEEDNS